MSETLPLSEYDPFPGLDVDPYRDVLPARPDGLTMYGPVHVDDRARLTVESYLPDGTLYDRFTGHHVVEGADGPDGTWFATVDGRTYRVEYVTGPDGRALGMGFRPWYPAGRS